MEEEERLWRIRKVYGRRRRKVYEGGGRGRVD